MTIHRAVRRPRDLQEADNPVFGYGYIKKGQQRFAAVTLECQSNDPLSVVQKMFGSGDGMYKISSAILKWISVLRPWAPVNSNAEKNLAAFSRYTAVPYALWSLKQVEKVVKELVAKPAKLMNWIGFAGQASETGAAFAHSTPLVTGRDFPLLGRVGQVLGVVASAADIVEEAEKIGEMGQLGDRIDVFAREKDSGVDPTLLKSVKETIFQNQLVAAIKIGAKALSLIAGVATLFMVFGVYTPPLWVGVATVALTTAASTASLVSFVLDSSRAYKLKNVKLPVDD
jgi:hypothetical protein